MFNLRRGLMRAVAPLLALAAVCAGMAGPVSAGVLQTVRDRGHVVCGVSDNLPGLSAAGPNGQWSGIEIEFCGAVAAAVFGDRQKVKFLGVSAAEAPRALNDGGIDILLGGTTWTLSRETELGMRSAGVLFHTGLGLMVPRAFGVSSVLEVSGASICLQQGTGADKAVGSYFASREMRLHFVIGETWADAVKAYKDGSCTLLAGDQAMLAVERAAMPDPGEHLLLPEMVTHEQTGPFVRQGDDPWLSVVNWTLLAMIEAEQLGLSQDTIADAADGTDVRVRRFLGKEAALAPSLGLPPNWTEHVVTEVGNYGEVFARTLGEGSRLNLARGANNPWDRGGLMSAPAFR